MLRSKLDWSIRGAQTCSQRIVVAHGRSTGYRSSIWRKCKCSCPVEMRLFLFVWLFFWAEKNWTFIIGSSDRRKWAGALDSKDTGETEKRKGGGLRESRRTQFFCHLLQLCRTNQNKARKEEKVRLLLHDTAGQERSNSSINHGLSPQSLVSSLLHFTRRVKKGSSDLTRNSWLTDPLSVKGTSRLLDGYNFHATLPIPTGWVEWECVIQLRKKIGKTGPPLFLSYAMQQGHGKTRGHKKNVRTQNDAENFGRVRIKIRVSNGRCFFFSYRHFYSVDHGQTHTKKNQLTHTHSTMALLIPYPKQTKQERAGSVCLVNACRMRTGIVAWTR